MEKEELYEKLITKGRNLNEIANEATRCIEMIPHLSEGVQDKNVRIRFGCFNTLVLISQNDPELLYPYFDVFVKYLDSDSSIIVLGGINNYYIQPLQG